MEEKKEQVASSSARHSSSTEPTRRVASSVEKRPAASAAESPGPTPVDAAQGNGASTLPTGKQRNPIARLLDYAGGYKKLTLVGCVLSGANALLSIAMLVCVFFVVRDLVAVAPNWSAATRAPEYGLWAMGFALAGLLVYFAALTCTHLAAFRTATNLRKAALERLSRVPLGYFATRSTGELRRIIEGSAGLTEGVLAHRLPDFVGGIVTPIAYIVVMFVFNWVLGLVCLIPIAVSAFCMWLMMGGGLSGKDGEGNSNVMTFMMNYQNALDKMNKAAVEYVRGIPVVKVFQQTVASFRSFNEAVKEYADFATAYVKLSSPPQVAQLTAINGTFAVLVPAGILLAASTGDFRVFLTDFLFYVVFSALTTMMMNKLMYASQAVTEAADALMRLEGIMAAPEVTEVAPDAARHPSDASISFESATFTYPGAEVPALAGFSLDVPASNTVALVGPSGGGKTTAASLVPRFWDVDAGCVRVGGVDVRAIPQEELMGQVAFVFQNDHLFKQSLADNIAAARLGATRAQIEAAAHAAQCDDIIAKLPQGLDTVVGAQGVYLSGGECQRIALARAILKDAPIVVLDEATAFADPENEALIQRALSELTRGKTVLMIAHRLSTVVHADRICVVDAGRVVEAGSHDELLAAEGVYARMWREYRQAGTWRIASAGVPAASSAAGAIGEAGGVGSAVSAAGEPVAARGGEAGGASSAESSHAFRSAKFPEEVH